MSFLMMYRLRSRFLLLLFLFLGISNILIIINYQYATKSSNYFVNSKDQNQELLLVNWKGLQIEIDTTFQKFTEIRAREGKDFKQAALYGKKLTLKVNISDEHGQVNSTSSSPDCNPAPILLIQIHSSPANFMERQAIRMSWGRPDNRINKANGWKQGGMSRLWKTVFLVGETKNPRLDKLLQQEAKIHNDMVFGNFIDSYRNLTKKMALGIEWAAKRCQAQYVMKADEDSFINVFQLIQFLRESNRSTPLYMGAAFIDTRPYREPDSPWYVSEEEYPNSKYPPYASGPGYVYSGSLLTKLFGALKTVRLFPNEDACFGYLMQHIKVNLTDNKRFSPFTMGEAVYSEKDGFSLCNFNGALVIHRISGKLQIQTHFNVLVLQHVPTICAHIHNGIGYTEYMWSTNLFSFPRYSDNKDDED